MNEKYISAFKITKQYDITSNTLRTWANEKSIRCLHTKDGKGKRIYNLQDVERVIGVDVQEKLCRETVCYARVSSNHQKEDLERQISILGKAYPEAKIIKDIGSGVNFKRQGFTSLLQRVYNGGIQEIVVTDKDRLCRFGFEIIEWLLKQTDTKLVVLYPVTNEKDDDETNLTRELADDLLTITNHFVAKHNGMRSSRNKRQRKQQEATSREMHKNKSVSVKVAERGIE